MWSLAFLALLFFRTSAEPADPLDSNRLEAVHAQRVQWMKIRPHAAPAQGVYQDFRAVLTKGAREELLKAAKQAGVQVVLFTTPKSGDSSVLHEGVLFLQGSEDGHALRFSGSPELRFSTAIEDIPTGFQGAIVHREPASPSPAPSKRLAAEAKLYPDEFFAATSDASPLSLSLWDKQAEAGVFTGVAASAPDAVAFRHLSTHILARELNEHDILESLASGRAYVAHDWLCDPTGFSFVADNNFGIFDMGDQVPLAGFGVGTTTLRASLPIAAKLKIIHDGAVVAEANDSKFVYTPKEPGAYRLEASLTIDGEDRPWIFTNPIYLSKSSALMLPAMAISPTVEVHKDITYTEGDPSDAAKHKLDLYLPKDTKNFPVLMFVHGGYWRSGDKSLYPALGNRFAKMGVGVVIPSYRLMPKNPHPAQIEDTAAAFAWMYKNIARYGGDPNRIYISGHSAGGHLVSLLALDGKYLKKYDIPLTAIKGVASISGVYDVGNMREFKNAAGDDSPSPMAHVHGKTPPFLISYCQWDYPSLPFQAREFAAALKKSFDPVELLYVPGQSHISEIIHVVHDDDIIAQAILKLIQ